MERYRSHLLLPKDALGSELFFGLELDRSDSRNCGWSWYGLPFVVWHNLNQSFIANILRNTLYRITDNYWIRIYRHWKTVALLILWSAAEKREKSKPKPDIIKGNIWMKPYLLLDFHKIIYFHNFEKKLYSFCLQMI